MRRNGGRPEKLESEPRRNKSALWRLQFQFLEYVLASITLHQVILHEEEINARLKGDGKIHSPNLWETSSIQRSMIKNEGSRVRKG